MRPRPLSRAPIPGGRTTYRIATLRSPSGQTHTLWARIRLAAPGFDPLVQWSTHPRDLR